MRVGRHRCYPRALLQATALLLLVPSCSGSEDVACGEGTVEIEDECVPSQGSGPSGTGGQGSGPVGSSGAGAGGTDPLDPDVVAMRYPECASPTFKGAAMVRRDWPSGEGYCIDVREARNGDFREFLASEPRAEDQPTACLESFPALLSSCSASDLQDEWGCVNVSWCSAYAYCEWAGKRLCQVLDFGVGDDGLVAPGQSEWLNACTGQGARAYSYGPSFDDQCRITGGPDSPCVDADGDIIGLSNDFAEWVGPCELQDGAVNPSCAFLGGTTFWFGDDPDGEGDAEIGRCDRYRTYPPEAGGIDITFRCCADLVE